MDTPTATEQPGACTCPRGPHPVTAFAACTCEWDELISMVMHIAYGASRPAIADCAPAIAAMAHDVITRAGLSAALPEF